EELAPASAGVIDGVRVIWITQGQRAARDETAFRHALATGHRLKSQGEPLKDNKLIDAYERAYNIAKPSEPTTANPTSHQCATVLLWPAESAHTSPKESLNRPSLTAARANPAQAEKH